MQKLNVKLPQYIIDSQLSKILREQLPDYMSRTSGNIIFDWSDVCFFDDYTLLKFIFIQRQLRVLGNKVSNEGFSSHTDKNKQCVLRQLWTVGLPELMASGHLIGGEQLKAALRDDAILLESDPLHGSQSQTAITSVIPMLCCHDRKYFAAGSREEKQLDAFIRACLRPSGTKSIVWDLVESRDFRHLMLQQLRRNVHEHSRPNGEVAIGLAIVRVWTANTLSDEWGLTESMQAKLLRAWNQEPIPSIFQKISTDSGILQISVVDDGAGIPRGLDTVHEGLIYKATQDDLFNNDKRVHYLDQEFSRRFAEPAAWPDNKARLIAFAMDLIGTSKHDRAPEVKGLQYLRERAVIEMGGAACIDSDGAAISHITRDRIYGVPRQCQLAWCNTGGTGVCLAVPMSALQNSSDNHKLINQPTAFSVSACTESGAERIKVKDHLPMIAHPSIYASHEVEACLKAIIGKIVLPEVEEDIKQLRQKGLLIVDWGELPDSKRVFHNLLVAIAKKLADTDPLCMRPFVFANLPKGLCGLLETTISKFSNQDNPTPICAFTAEQREPFWLGMEGENSIPEELRGRVSCEIHRKITDKKENRTEAFYRDCLTQVLDSSRAMALLDTAVLHRLRYEDLTAIQQSSAYSRLDSLVRQCALFRQEKRRSADGEAAYTGRFHPVFSLEEIAAVVRTLFLDEFRDIFTKSPVCFIPPNKKEGIQLPHSKRVVKRYFRSDALVDSIIALELTQELSSIAFGIARQMLGGRIDWVVSCTSPLHWFVHKIVDGLSEYGMICSHHVFASYEDIPVFIEDIRMHAGETVLVFTDVIASGQTAYQMAASLVNHYGVRMAGLIALADIRTKEDRNNGPDLETIYGGTIVALYNEPEPHCQELIPTYYVHPETVVPKKRDINSNPTEEFFNNNYSGTGPLVEDHGYFSIAKRTLDQMTSHGAVRFGHYQHGSHHSEIFVDVEKVLSNRAYRNLIVTALFRYIVAHDIRLVLYPNHSSAYMLADDLKQRFDTGELSVEIITACRTFRGRGTQGTSYTLTRFTPHPEPVQWKKFSSNAVLILDDAVCSGTTVESIMAELARIESKYYDSTSLTHPEDIDTRFSIHVVAFLNRLPRVTGDFWKGLSRVAAGRVQFSSFISMPLAADSEELCPQCRLRKELEHANNSIKYCLYAKEFLSWWLSSSEVVSSHERRHFANQQSARFSSEEALRLAGYLSAIERKAYNDICKQLFDTPGKVAEEQSNAVRIHVRCRAGFLHDLFPRSDKSADSVDDLCNELGNLIDMTLSNNGLNCSQAEALEILQGMTQRYLRMRPAQDEVERVFDCILIKFAKVFDNRLIVGGIATVLDTCLSWFAPPEQTGNEWIKLRHLLKAKVNRVDRALLPEKAALTMDWFDTYLAEGGERINSVGEAVKMLADFAKKGRRNHFYGRHELDELGDAFRRSPMQASADEAPEIIRRTLICTDRFIELVRATRVLQSASKMEEGALKSLQDATELDIQSLRKLCHNLLKGENADDAVKNYTEIKNQYLRTYNRWFPTGERERPKAVEVIGYFTPNLCDTLQLAWEKYLPLRLAKEHIAMDMSDLTRHNSMRVLVDPVVLTTAMLQLLDNIDKLAAQDAPVSILCQLRLSEHDPAATDRQPNIAAGLVGVVVSNTMTPRPKLSHIKPRGLSEVKMRLSEFGGGLDYTVPETDWSFEVVMKLLVWTEGEK